VGSLAANRRRKRTQIVVIAGLALFVVDVFAFNGEDFPYLVAGLIVVLALVKWLLAWTPLPLWQRGVLVVLAVVPWIIVRSDPYPALHGSTVATCSWLGLCLVVLRQIDGRAIPNR